MKLKGEGGGVDCPSRQPFLNAAVWVHNAMSVNEVAAWQLM